MRRIILSLSAVALLALCFVPLVGQDVASVPRQIPEPADLRPEAHFPRIATRIAENLPISHLNRAEFDDDISKSALDDFLRVLDYDRTLFLWEDVRGFRANRLKLDDLLKDGSTDFAFEVFDIYRERLADRVAYVHKLLDDGFDLTIDETYAWKRKKAPWPKNEQEQDELWRLKIKNEYVSMKVARTLAEEKAAAKKKENPDAAEDDKDGEEKEKPPSIEENIRKRYDAILTNVNQHDAEYVLQLYLSSFTRSYDTHSAYMGPRNFEDFNINIGLSLTGIGAQLTIEDGAALKISSVIKGGPADQRWSPQEGRQDHRGRPGQGGDRRHHVLAALQIGPAHPRPQGHHRGSQGHPRRGPRPHRHHRHRCCDKVKLED